jgi:hypothetical protein
MRVFDLGKIVSGRTPPFVRGARRGVVWVAPVRGLHCACEFCTPPHPPTSGFEPAPFMITIQRMGCTYKKQELGSRDQPGPRTTGLSPGNDAAADRVSFREARKVLSLRGRRGNESAFVSGRGAETNASAQPLGYVYFGKVRFRTCRTPHRKTYPRGRDCMDCTDCMQGVKSCNDRDVPAAPPNARPCRVTLPAWFKGG